MKRICSGLCLEKYSNKEIPTDMFVHEVRDEGNGVFLFVFSPLCQNAASQVVEYQLLQIKLARCHMRAIFTDINCII